MNLDQNIDETRSCIIEEIIHNNLMSENNKKMCRSFSFFEDYFALVSTVNECVLISAYASLVGVTVDTVRFAVGLKICVITAGIKLYKSIIKWKSKKHHNLEFLVKTKLNTIKVFLSEGLIESYINHDDFFLLNNVSREHNDLKEEIKNRVSPVKYTVKKQW